MKALIKVGYGCNDHCTFCHALHVRHVEGSAEEVHRKIERAKQLGHTMVVLSGGEPTIRPELVRWAAHVASVGMDFGLVTNGRMLSYPKLVAQLLGSRLRYVHLSLHGGTAEVHDRMVRSKAFDQTFGAIANLSGRGLDLTVNCVVTRHNVDHLRELVDAVVDYPELTLKLSMVEPKGGADELFDHLVPRVALVAERVREAVAYAERRVGERGGVGPRLVHGAIPLCLLPGLEDRYSDLQTHGFWTMTEVGEPDFFPVDDLNKLQPVETCTGCAMNGPCPGLYRGYYEAHGADELSPLSGIPREGSFEWVREGVTRAPAGECPLRDGPLGVTPWDRGRHLFVREGERIVRFRALGRGFSDAEIASIKHDAGQVYLDVASLDPGSHDFPCEIVKLERSALCEGCAAREKCTGMFDPVAEDVLARDDAGVRGLLGSLAGDVLDVGCGGEPYASVLAPLAEQGRIRYVGLDRDAERAASLRARWPWAELVVGSPEGPSALSTSRFDHVLVLRRWNHLPDPDAALARLVTAMKPGATLTVVDRVAFGLARGTAQASREPPPSPGRYRNDSAGEAHGRIAALGLELLERRDVGPATGTEWLLRYRHSAACCSATA